MATETNVSWELIKTCAELIPNIPLEQELAASFGQIPAPALTGGELRFMERITASSGADKNEALQRALNWLEKPEDRAAVQARMGEPFHGQPLPYQPLAVPPVGGGSTDVGDVSRQCPTAQIYTATWAPGSGGHTWQIVAQGQGFPWPTSICATCGKVLGQTAIRLMQHPEKLAKARRGLAGRAGKAGSYLPIPGEVRPRAISSLGRR